jgi:hypothetical protein
VGDYELKGAPASWSKVVAIRHAMAKFPECYYFWYLDQDSFVMNPQLTIEDHVMKSSRLEKLMIKDQPVVPPDSIIKTFTHLKGQNVDFVVTQDKEGLSVGSFVLRNGDWAKFFVETWFDPIYRSYNFQKAEAHALVSALNQPGPRWTKAHPFVGTYRAMASHDPVAAGHCGPESHQLIQQQRQGRRIQGRRHSGALSGLCQVGTTGVRVRVSTLLATVADVVQGCVR